MCQLKMLEECDPSVVLKREDLIAIIRQTLPDVNPNADIVVNMQGENICYTIRYYFQNGDKFVYWNSEGFYSPNDKYAAEDEVEKFIKSREISE